MGALSIKEKLNHKSPSVEWVEDGPWDTRLTVANQLLGGWQNVGGFLAYCAPAYYADIPSLVCQNVDLEHNGEIDPATGEWAKARFTITFSRPDENTLEFGEVGLNVKAEALSLPKGTGAFEWADGPDSGKPLKADDVTPQALISIQEIKLKRKSPYLQLGPIMSRIGRLNSGVVTIEGYGYAMEWMLFAGASVSKKFTSSGDDLWEYEFSLLAKTYSWNTFLHKSGSFYRLSPNVYGLADQSYWFV